MSSSLLFLRALQSEIAPVNVNKLTIIMGDFNLIKTDWLNSRTVLNHTTADEKLLLFSQHCGFLQVVHEPTHKRNFTDLVFFSLDNFACDVNDDIPFSTSDHCSVVVSLPRSAFINVNESTHIPNNKPQAYFAFGK